RAVVDRREGGGAVGGVDRDHEGRAGEQFAERDDRAVGGVSRVREQGGAERLAQRAGVVDGVLGEPERRAALGGVQRVGAGGEVHGVDEVVDQGQPPRRGRSLTHDATVPFRNLLATLPAAGEYAVTVTCRPLQAVTRGG